MPIDLKHAAGERVFIHLSRPTYLISKEQGHLVPAVMPTGKTDPSGQQQFQPIAMDYLLGSLHEVDGQFILHYVTPNRTQMRVLINPDEVVAVFYEGKIDLATAADMPKDPPSVSV